MKNIFYFLPFFLIPFFLFGQEDAYSEIEVWGIEDSARAHFFGIHEERELPICAASLKILGYPHGNRILLEDGRQILTLRSYPPLPWKDSTAIQRTYDSTGVWEEILALDVFSIETQLTHLYYPAFLQQDSGAFRQFLQDHQQQFQLYGFEADEQKMKHYCATLSRISEITTLQEVMDILTYADSASKTIKLAAAFLLPALIQTDEEAIALLPMLFDEDANRIQHALRYYFLLPNKRVDWEPALATIPILLQHPDPLVVMDIIEILDHTGIDPAYTSRILSHGATTLQEIMESDFTNEWQQEIISFLEKNNLIDPGSSPQDCLQALKDDRH